jgi:hypothetical protein
MLMDESDVNMGYEFGVILGKLRRLQDLTLDLFRDGRADFEIAVGLAMTDPLPLLRRVMVPLDLKANPDQVICLLLPSVRVFGTVPVKNSRSTLLIACALRRAGYKHRVVLNLSSNQWKEAASTVHAIVGCRVGGNRTPPPS